MCRPQVIRDVGQPDSTYTQNGAEYLIYNLSDTRDDAVSGKTTEYYVKIVGGWVDAVGEVVK